MAQKGSRTTKEKRTAGSKSPTAKKNIKKASNSKPEVLPLPYLSQPALSSDGSQVAFNYASDIWLVSSAGGQARQITSNIRRDSMPCFSPDDKTIAFLSERSGSQNIFIAGLGSDLPPRRLTWHTASGGPLRYSKNGKWIYFTSNLDRQSRGIYKIPVSGATPIRLISDPKEAYGDQAISPNGNQMVFRSDGDTWWRRGPNPAMASHLWLMDEASGAVEKKLTSYEGLNTLPMWDAKGKGVYFVSDRSGRENIWYMTLNGDSRARQITHFEDGRLIRPSISLDGNWISFERDFRIWLLNLKDKSVAPIDIQLQTDEKFRSRSSLFIIRGYPQSAN
ncbi:MAG: DPP IV N-terminal domain-containing protein [Calditrichota bacterium]